MESRVFLPDTRRRRGFLITDVPDCLAQRDVTVISEIRKADPIYRKRRARNNRTA